MADLGSIGKSGGGSGTSTKLADGPDYPAPLRIHLLGEKDVLVFGEIGTVLLTFTFRPTTCQQSRKFRVLSSQFGDGYEQRVEDGLNASSLEFSLTFERLPEDKGDEIADFLDARKGVEAFYWTPPRGTQGTYVCTEPYQREWNPDVDGESGISCVFRQVFEI